MLPAIPTPRETITVAGVAIDIRGLTVGECKQLQELEGISPEATGVQALAWGCDVTVEEAQRWVDATSPQFGVEVATHIMRLSGMTEAAAARFPARVPPRNGGDRRVRPGRPAPQDTRGDPSHAAS